jgi:hypothetical protein
VAGITIGPAFQASVLGTTVTTVKDVTTVTAGDTFLPPSRTGKVTTFSVVPRSGHRDCPFPGH